MAYFVDARGLSCPQPILLLHDAVKAGKDAYDVLVDNEASAENVARAGEKLGFTVTVVELNAVDSRVELRR